VAGDLRILLVGAGQIGSRHLQALASIPDVAEVVAVDPDPQARDRALARWREIAGHAGKTITFHSEFGALKAERYDLAVLATSAPGRLDLLRRVVDLGVRRVLSEKLLFQSVAQLDRALTLCDARDVTVYPNYVYRFAAPWAEVARKAAGRPVAMSVEAGDIGLATNLPHWLDLFEFISGSPLTELSIALARPAIASKRGGGLVEVAGSARGSTASGSTVSLMFDGPSSAPVATLSLAGKTLRIDEGPRTVAGDLIDPPPGMDVPMVSLTTTRAVPQIIAGTTVLPTLAGTAVMNRLLLAAMGRALFADDNPEREIPIT
jgi:predicted dehydrogenase